MEKLLNEREKCENVLKEQVFGNYGRFISSTSKIQYLGADMSALRRMLTEQQQTIYVLNSVCESSSQFSSQIIKKLQNEGIFK